MEPDEDMPAVWWTDACARSAGLPLPSTRRSGAGGRDIDTVHRITNQAGRRAVTGRRITTEGESAPKGGLRKREDGVWIKTDCDRVVSEADLEWALDAFSAWEVELPGSLSRQLGLGPGGGEAGDREPRTPLPTAPSHSEHRPEPKSRDR